MGGGAAARRGGARGGAAGQRARGACEAAAAAPERRLSAAPSRAWRDGSALPRGGGAPMRRWNGGSRALGRRRPGAKLRRADDGGIARGAAAPLQLPRGNLAKKNESCGHTRSTPRLVGDESSTPSKGPWGCSDGASPTLDVCMEQRP